MNNIHNYLERTHNGTSFSGSDMDILRAHSTAGALRLYAAARIVPSRGITPTGMLKAAGEFLGKQYKRGQYELAADDLDTWAYHAKTLPKTN